VCTLVTGSMRLHENNGNIRTIVKNNVFLIFILICKVLEQ